MSVNSQTKKIITFKDADLLYTDYMFDLTTCALSIDPLAAKYPMLSPYHCFANNPIIYIDPDGRDIWVALQYATAGFSSGHMVLAVSTYKEVQVNVIKNNEIVQETYYVKTGYALIQNMPHDSDKTATEVTEKNGYQSAEADIMRQTAIYTINTDKGALGVTLFNQALNPDIDPLGTYYSKEEISAEQSILKNAYDKMADNTQNYDHGKDYSTQNDCSSIIIELLNKSGAITNPKTGVASVSINDKTYDL